LLSQIDALGKITPVHRLLIDRRGDRDFGGLKLAHLTCNRP
jgi:hypothetical protein